jgi:hypothetical protein
MPTSTSPRRSAERAPGAARGPERGAASRLRLGLSASLLALIAAVAVIVAVLPASLIKRVLPPMLEAEDFSGTLWHGSAGSLRLSGRPLGAIEWRLHPLALLAANVDADLHWVLGGFVLDGRLAASRRRLHLSQLEGGGPVEDLASLGVPGNLRGIAQVSLARLDATLEGGLTLPVAAAGSVRVVDLSMDAASTPIGSYVLEMPAPGDAAGAAASVGASPDTESGSGAARGAGASGDLTGRVHDIGGALGLDALVRFAPATRMGTVSGTVQARGPLPPALQQGINDLAQLHAPDAQGRLPIDLELHL